MRKIEHSPVWAAGVQNAVNYYVDLMSLAAVSIEADSPFISPEKFRPVRDFHGKDNNHYPMHPHYLEVGLIGIAEEAEASAKKHDGEERLLLNAVAETYRATAAYMARFADEAEKVIEGAETDGDRQRIELIAKTCRALSVRAPETFFEAAQLFLFCWRIRSHKGMATIGRLDQYLIDFYRRDVSAGILTDDKALELLVALWKRINTYGSGDTLTNIMLGGVDADGNDVTNELSCLMIRASLITKSTDPQINCRVHKNTPPEFFELMTELQLLGHGQASLYNDEVVIPGLLKYGYSLKDARNYSNDGCSEIIIDAASTIDFFQMEAVKTMELTIFEGRENPTDNVPVGHYWSKNIKPRTLTSKVFLGYSAKSISDITSYEDFYAAYLAQYRFQLMGRIDEKNASIINSDRNQIPSLFLLGSFPCFLQSGVDIHYAWGISNMHQIFIGSIPTVGDCLAAIKKVVFEDKACTLLELREAMRADFVGYEDLRARLLAAPKFGNDDDYVDTIVSRLSSDIIDMIDEYNANAEIKHLPCHYNFLFNDYAKTVGATPDGRRRGDPISEHFTPTPGRAKKGPTAVLRSVVKTDIQRGAGASTVHLSLSRDTLVGEDGGKAIMAAIMRAAIGMGIQLLNVAVYDADALRKAQENPEGHEDIIVRVWGYSARFVDLSRDMQDHVIARIIKEGQ